MAPAHEIDIQENSLRHRGNLLDILLIDRTSGKNIIWATDSYEAIGKDFAPKKHIKKELVTGQHGELIQPRAAKPLAEQKQRTRDKAEVFTPVKIVDKMNNIVDWPNESWQAYVSKTILEISCGEAPFIVSRYNPTAHTGKLIKLSNRVGFLDRKLRVVSKFCDTPRERIKWAKHAYMASYGYEWQGDNLLIARENLLYTLIDYYQDKFGRKPSLDLLRSFAEIISWNIFQMDGLKYVIPMSCEGKSAQNTTQVSIFPVEDEKQEQLSICEGCTSGNYSQHTGKYVRIMDWTLEETNRFVDILSK